jgi:nitrous oxide reductase accessory protein NosL
MQLPAHINPQSFLIVTQAQITEEAGTVGFLIDN